MSRNRRSSPPPARSADRLEDAQGVILAESSAQRLLNDLYLDFSNIIFNPLVENISERNLPKSAGLTLRPGHLLLSSGSLSPPVEGR
jgi:hypothetical protein